MLHCTGFDACCVMCEDSGTENCEGVKCPCPISNDDCLKEN